MFPLIVVASMIVLAVIAIMIGSHHPFFKMTSKTIGVVEESRQQESTGKSGTRVWATHVTFSYQVHGEKLKLSKVVDGAREARFPPGRRFNVWYNPANPDEARVQL